MRGSSYCPRIFFYCIEHIRPAQNGKTVSVDVTACRACVFEVSSCENNCVILGTTAPIRHVALHTIESSGCKPMRCCFDIRIEQYVIVCVYLLQCTVVTIRKAVIAVENNYAVIDGELTLQADLRSRRLKHCLPRSPLRPACVAAMLDHEWKKFCEIDPWVFQLSITTAIRLHLGDYLSIESCMKPQYLRILGSNCIRCHQFTFPQIRIASREICNKSAGFGNDESSRCDIPRLEIVFVKCFESSAGNIREIGSRRT
jgi:hypothetical protein